MDVIKLLMPASFVRERTQLTWREAHFGLANDLLDPPAAAEFAEEQVDVATEPSAALLQLAGASGQEGWVALVVRLAEAEAPRSEEEIRSKWRYLVLARIHEHRDQSPNPLRSVEEVYPDFGYPERIAKFVRYMPMSGPDLGSPEANERRLFERYQAYLDDAARP